MKTAVLGLGFGDEGKGRVVDWLCSHEPDSLVVRFSGGSNASHKVYRSDNSISHAFSNLGSGTFRGCPTYWSEFCTFDPADLVAECRLLRKVGVGDINIFVNEDCPVVTSWDKKYNKIQNDELILQDVPRLGSIIQSSNGPGLVNEILFTPQNGQSPSLPPFPNFYPWMW